MASDLFQTCSRRSTSISIGLSMYRSLVPLPKLGPGSCCSTLLANPHAEQDELICNHEHTWLSDIASGGGPGQILLQTGDHLVRLHPKNTEKGQLVTLVWQTATRSPESLCRMTRRTAREAPHVVLQLSADGAGGAISNHLKHGTRHCKQIWA